MSEARVEIAFKGNGATVRRRRAGLLAWCRSLGIDVVARASSEDVGEESAAAGESGAEIADGNGHRHFVNRAARARLKRCRGPAAAAFEPAFEVFLTYLEPDENERRRLYGDKNMLAGLARVAILIPHVAKADMRASLGAQMGGSEIGREQPRVSRLRVQALIQEADVDRALERWRRTLPLLKGGCNAFDLAQLMLWWSERDRRDLAFDYFGAVAGLSASKTA